MEEILCINTDNNINQSKNATNFRERVWTASEKSEGGGMGRIG